MIGLASLVVAVLFAAGIYQMLSRNTQRIAIGFILLSNGVNLLVLTSGGLPPGAVPPLVGAEGTGLAYADPLPQAFILTAIVIGLGTAAFLLAMAAKAHRETGTDQLTDAETELGHNAQPQTGAIAGREAAAAPRPPHDVRPKPAPAELSAAPGGRGKGGA